MGGSAVWRTRHMLCLRRARRIHPHQPHPMTDTPLRLHPHDPASDTRGEGVRWLEQEPYYVAAGEEVRIFEQCHAQGLPVMLKGPTGCGKTRFVEHMAWRLE